MFTHPALQIEKLSRLLRKAPAVKRLRTVIPPLPIDSIGYRADRVLNPRGKCSDNLKISINYPISFG